MWYLINITIICSKLSLFSGNHKKSKSGGCLSFKDDVQNSFDCVYTSPIHKETIYDKVNFTIKEFENTLSLHLSILDDGNINQLKKTPSHVIRYLKDIFISSSSKYSSYSHYYLKYFDESFGFLDLYMGKSDSVIYWGSKKDVSLNLFKRIILNALVLKEEISKENCLGHSEILSSTTSDSKEIMEVQQKSLLKLFNVNFTSSFQNMDYIKTCNAIEQILILKKYEMVNEVSLQDNLKKYKKIRRSIKKPSSTTYDSPCMKNRIIRRVSSNFDTLVKIEFGYLNSDVDSIFHVFALAIKEIVFSHPTYFDPPNFSMNGHVSLQSLYKDFTKDSSNFKLEQYFLIIHYLKKLISQKIDFTDPYFESYFEVFKEDEHGSIIHQEKNTVKNFRKLFVESFFESPTKETIPIFFNAFSEIFDLNVEVFDYDEKKLIYESKISVNPLKILEFGLFKSELYFIKNGRGKYYSE